MRVVVDTNVVAYLLLGTKPFVAECKDFWAGVSEPTAPAVWEAELANVTWMAARSGVISEIEGQGKLRLAGRLGIRSVATRSLWQGAYVRSLGSGVAVYDTLFVELAVRRGIPLATFDKELLKRFPDVATRPGAVSV